MAATPTPHNRSRWRQVFVICLIAMLDIFLIATIVWKVERTPSMELTQIPQASQTSSATPSPANTPASTPTPSPTPVPVQATATPIVETKYTTPNGLRFVDAVRYKQKLQAAPSLLAEEAVLKQFGLEYGLNITFGEATPSWYAAKYGSWNTLQGADAGTLRQYGQVLIDEWSKYPKVWVQESHLSGIAIVQNLVVSGDKRGGMPDVVGRVLYLQPDLVHVSETTARGTIHHEFDHLIEYYDFGQFDHPDPAWSALNTSGFQYGAGGAAWNDSGFSDGNMPHTHLGFVDEYATTAIAEDKAELYAYLFVGVDYHILNQWISSDPYLAKKVAAYKAFIRQQDPIMNDAYFSAINL